MNPPGLSFIGVLPPLPGAEPGVVGLLPGLLLFGDKGPKTYNIPEQVNTRQKIFTAKKCSTIILSIFTLSRGRALC